MSSKSAVTIDTKTAETLLKEIEAIRKSVDALRKKVINFLPTKYGSDRWWEREIEEGLEEVKQGKVFGPFKNANELIKTLHQQVGR